MAEHNFTPVYLPRSFSCALTFKPCEYCRLGFYFHSASSTTWSLGNLERGVRGEGRPPPSAPTLFLEVVEDIPKSQVLRVAIISRLRHEAMRNPPRTGRNTAPGGGRGHPCHAALQCIRCAGVEGSCSRLRKTHKPFTHNKEPDGKEICQRANQESTSRLKRGARREFLSIKKPEICLEKFSLNQSIKIYPKKKPKNRHGRERGQSSIPALNTEVSREFVVGVAPTHAPGGAAGEGGGGGGERGPRVSRRGARMGVRRQSIR